MVEDDGEENDFQAEGDADHLMHAHEIRQDSDRHANALRVLKLRAATHAGASKAESKGFHKKTAANMKKAFGSKEKGSTPFDQNEEAEQSTPFDEAEKE